MARQLKGASTRSFGGLPVAQRPSHVRSPVYALGMTESASPDEGPDDIRHLRTVQASMHGDPLIGRMGYVIGLLGEGLGLAPRPEWDRVFANDLSALACLGRAYRQLRAAAALAHLGYYAEVRLILRAVYESAALSRMIAKEPALAEKWLRKEHWFPDREVRSWMSGRRNDLGNSEEIMKDYSKFYRTMSAWSHPTAISCMEIVKPQPEHPNRPGLNLNSTFDESVFRMCVIEVASTAMFACFAFRNAVVDERAIDPDWRRRLYEVSATLVGHEMPHLQRDWDEERRQYDRLKTRVQTADRIAERLRDDPLSWRNLKDSEPPSPA